MTSPLAEQVAGLKVGEWVEARFEDNGTIIVVTAPVSHGMSNALWIKGFPVRFGSGLPHPNLTSIIRVPRPIPSEPEVGSFALLKSGGVTRRGRVSEQGTSGDGLKSWFATDETYYSWPEIYPHIIRLYTPNGDLVEGFEYATREEG